VLASVRAEANGRMPTLPSPADWSGSEGRRGSKSHQSQINATKIDLLVTGIIVMHCTERQSRRFFSSGNGLRDFVGYRAHPIITERKSVP
jgi:hypothetical protein